MMSPTIANSIKWMFFLYRMRQVDGLTLIQFVQNVVTQYGVGVAISTVGESITPWMLVEPGVKTVRTGINYLMEPGLPPTEQGIRVAQVETMAALSAASTTTDTSISDTTAGVNFAFLTYMQKIIEASNHGNTPFIVPSKNGQGEVMLFILVVSSVGFMLVYAASYGIKQYVRLLKTSYTYGSKLVKKLFKKKSPKVQLIIL